MEMVLNVYQFHLNRFRTHDCGTEPQIEIVPCNTDAGYYLEWTKWSRCTATCGGGLRSRSRKHTCGRIDDAVTERCNVYIGKGHNVYEKEDSLLSSLWARFNYDSFSQYHMQVIYLGNVGHWRMTLPIITSIFCSFVLFVQSRFILSPSTLSVHLKFAALVKKMSLRIFHSPFNKPQTFSFMIKCFWCQNYILILKSRFHE